MVCAGGLLGWLRRGGFEASMQWGREGVRGTLIGRACLCGVLLQLWVTSRLGWQDVTVRRSMKDCCVFWVFEMRLGDWKECRRKLMVLSMFWLVRYEEKCLSSLWLVIRSLEVFLFTYLILVLLIGRRMKCEFREFFDRKRWGKNLVLQEVSANNSLL